MQNITTVRKLLLEPGGIVDANGGEVLKSVFDHIIEDGDSELKIKHLLFDLIRGKRGSMNSRLKFNELQVEAVPNVIKAVVYGFPNLFSLIPEIVLQDFRVHASHPTIYKEDVGVHAMIIVTLLKLADDEAFDRSDLSFDKPLASLLKEGLQKRYFRDSIIYNHQTSLLSSALKVFIDRAYAWLFPAFRSTFRWDSLVDVLAISNEMFLQEKETHPGDATLEYALINEICFKMFNTCPLNTKVAMLKQYCDQYE